MKIKFKKLEPTQAFVKLFGRHRHQPDTADSSDVYEYYYKRGNTYYFRNDAGEKQTVDYTAPPAGLVRGQKYKIDDIGRSH